MKSNSAKQWVSPWVTLPSWKWKSWAQVSWLAKTSDQSESTEQDQSETQLSSQKGLKLWRGSKNTSAWPEILPPEMDERYFKNLQLSIMERLKEKRFKTE